MSTTETKIEARISAIDLNEHDFLNERLKLLAKKIEFLVERGGESHRELFELREEIQKALILKNTAEKEKILTRGEELLTSPEFEIEIENLAGDPLLVEKAETSGLVFDELRKNPQTNLAELEAEKFVKNPELLTAISEDPELWEKIKQEGKVGIIVADALKDPKTWNEKIGETGDSIAEFVKRNPEITAAAAAGLTLGGILMLFEKSKIKKALGTISLGIAGFLGFKKWGEAVGYLFETGLKQLGVSPEIIAKWKSKKEIFEKEVNKRVAAAKEKGDEVKKSATQKVEDLKNGATKKIEHGKETINNWKTELADFIGQQINDEELNPILAKWAAGKKLEENEKMSVSEILLKNGFLLVVVDGGWNLVKGATIFPMKWAEGVGNSIHGLFSRGIERSVIEYLKGGAPFAVFGGSVEAARAIFTTSTKKSIFKSFLKGAAKSGVNYGYKIPVIILKGGGIAGQFVYDIATKGLTKIVTEGLAKAATKVERPLAKSAIRKLERQLLKLCGENATKKFIQAALKKTGMKKVGQFLAKRAAAAGGSAMTGVGTTVSVGILAWTLHDVGIMSYEGYKIYDLNKKLTARGKMKIKNFYLDTTTQKKIAKNLPKTLKDVEELQTLEFFKKLPTATLFIEREGKNDRERWTFKNGKHVDTKIEKI
jgi:hypothetical protein